MEASPDLLMQLSCCLAPSSFIGASVHSGDSVNDSVQWNSSRSEAAADNLAPSQVLRLPRRQVARSRH